MEIPEEIAAWALATRDVPARGLEVGRTASAGECAVLAKLAEVESVEEFKFGYTIKPDRGDTFRLKGSLSARIVQACVLTLEPVESWLNEEFACRFGAAPGRAADTSEDKPILEAEDWEPIDNARLDIGRILAETFVSAVDPFPRKDGAAFDWTDPKAQAATGSVDLADDGSGRPNPFAVLAKLKPKA